MQNLEFEQAYFLSVEEKSCSANIPSMQFCIIMANYGIYTFCALLNLKWKCKVKLPLNFGAVWKYEGRVAFAKSVSKDI